jgi:SAM-dependent methyltransferase
MTSSNLNDAQATSQPEIHSVLQKLGNLKDKIKLLCLHILFKLGFKATFYFDDSSPSVKQMGYQNARKLILIESHFHHLILKETLPEKRFKLYCENNASIKDFKANVLPGNLTYGFTSDYILVHSDLFENRSVIDFGCGYGLSTELLSKYANKVYGIDCVEACINSAKNMFEDVTNIEFKLIDNLKLPIADCSIGAAYSNDFIEHIHPDDAIFHLQEIYRVLETGGSYLIWTPGKNTGPHDITKAFYPQRHGFKSLGSHIQEYTFEELADLIRQIGFTTIIIPDPAKEVLLIATK